MTDVLQSLIERCQGLIGTSYGESFNAGVKAVMKEIIDYQIDHRHDSAWQPIETAPKDGTHILLRCPLAPCAVGSWFETKSTGWWTMNCMPITPTHWMSIPEPPL